MEVRLGKYERGKVMYLGLVGFLDRIRGEFFSYYLIRKGDWGLKKIVRGRVVRFLEVYWNDFFRRILDLEN